VAAPTTPTALDRAASMQHLVRRYLEGFGPASPQDVAQFAHLRRQAVRDALSALAEELEQLEVPDGVWCSTTCPARRAQPRTRRRPRA